MKKSSYRIIGGSRGGAAQAVWPAGQTAITVIFKPGTETRYLAKAYTMTVFASSAVEGAVLTNFNAADLDGVSGSANGAPVSLFRADSTDNGFYMKPPSPSVPHEATFTVATAPTADAAFSCCLKPVKPTELAQHVRSSRRTGRRVKRALKRAARRGKRGIIRNLAGKLKGGARRLLTALWGAPGVGTISDATIAAHLDDHSLEQKFDPEGLLLEAIDAVDDEELGDAFYELGGDAFEDEDE